jgi:hypothetical protein
MKRIFVMGNKNQQNSHAREPPIKNLDSSYLTSFFEIQLCGD